MPRPQSRFLRAPPGGRQNVRRTAKLNEASGDAFTLTTNEIIGDRQRVFVSFPRLPAVVKLGDVLFLNDGIIQLEVVRVERQDVRCRLLVGGELRSRKGLNLAFSTE